MMVEFSVLSYVLSFFVIVCGTTSQSEVDKHLEMGRDLLSRGQLQDALSHYHAAVGESDGVGKQYICAINKNTFAKSGMKSCYIIVIDKNIILLNLFVHHMH